MSCTLGSQVSIVMMVCNEEFWIDLALRPILELQLPLYIADCASIDNTPNIIMALQEQVEYSYPQQLYFVRHEKITPSENGLVRQDLARQVATSWILQIDGDELWAAVELEKCLSLDLCELDGFRTGFVHSLNILWQDGKFVGADGVSAHRLHRKDAQWKGIYPFESTTDFLAQKGYYFQNGPHLYHARYLQRSSQDSRTFMREEKARYFESRSTGKEIDLFGILGSPQFANPYNRVI